MAAPEDGEDKKAGKNNHGFPRGFRFVPEDLELLDILDDKLRGVPLDRAHELYDTYVEDEENGYIYFFSTIEFKGAKKKRRPRRAAQGGRWKVVFGSCQTVEVGGVAGGRKLTMEFYVKGLRTNWGMHEFARIIGPNNEVSGLAVYRLYKIWTNGEEKPEDLAEDDAGSMNQRGQASATDQYATSQAYAPSQLQPEWGHLYTYGAAETPGIWWAPPTAPGPVWWAPQTSPEPVWWPPPTAPGHVWWAPPTAPASPSAPGHYDYFASTDSWPPPPVAASTLGQKGKGKGKAPMTSTEHAGPTNTSAPPAANYQPPPPPPPQGTEHIFGSGVVVGHEHEEGYLVVDERNTQQGSSSVAAAPAVLEDDDDDGRAGGAGEGGSSASGR